MKNPFRLPEIITEIPKRFHYPDCYGDYAIALKVFFKDKSEEERREYEIAHAVAYGKLNPIQMMIYHFRYSVAWKSNLQFLFVALGLGALGVLLVAAIVKQLLPQ